MTRDYGVRHPVAQAESRVARVGTGQNVIYRSVPSCLPIQVLDERLEDTFRDWYPDFRTPLPTRSSRRLKHPDFYALQIRL